LRNHVSSFVGSFRYIVATGIGGAEEVAVPLARDLHPEFGYAGSAPRVFRRLVLILSFMVFGLVVGASGVAVFMADPDPDPMHAMALAPAQAPLDATRAPQTAAVETKSAQAPLAQRTSKSGTIKSPCRENTTELLGSDCTPGRAARPRPVQALNERPAIAAVPIGHRDDPAVLPSLPAIPVAAAPPTPAIPLAAAPVMPETPAAFATPAEVAPVANAAPAVARKKARARSDQAQVRRRERDRNEVSSVPRFSEHTNFEAGYARTW
jgi:hypothetical protein